MWLDYICTVSGTLSHQLTTLNILKFKSVVKPYADILETIAIASYSN